MRRRRYQKGSLQKAKHGKTRVWILQYYDAGGHHRYRTLGRMTDLTKGQAEQEQAKFMLTINGGDGEPRAVRPVLVSEFVSQMYLPFYRRKWKESTKGTSENRIQFHIVGDLGNCQLESFGPTGVAGIFGKQSGYPFILGGGPSSLGSNLNMQFGGRGEDHINEPGDEPLHAQVSKERSVS